jgi:hypothetical protein
MLHEGLSKPARRQNWTLIHVFAHRSKLQAGLFDTYPKTGNASREGIRVAPALELLTTLI